MNVVLCLSILLTRHSLCLMGAISDGQRTVFSSNCPSRVVDEYSILFSEQKELQMNSLPPNLRDSQYENVVLNGLS